MGILKRKMKPGKAMAIRLPNGKIIKVQIDSINPHGRHAELSFHTDNFDGTIYPAPANDEDYNHG